MALLKLYHRRPHDVRSPMKGAEEGDATPRRGWPPIPRWRRFPNWYATPVGLRSPRRRNPLKEPMLTPTGQSQDGRRFVPPSKRPSTGIAARKGRERPRLRIAIAAPGSFSGVAHAPRVSVWDVLGRACRPWGMLSANPHEPDLELNPRRISNLPRFCRGSLAVLHPTFQERSSVHRVTEVGHSLCRYGSGTARYFECCDKHHGELICRRSGSRFSVSAWARQGSASPLRALDPPGALPMLCNYRSDGTSGSIPVRLTTALLARMSEVVDWR